MKADLLYQAGKLNEAIEALSGELRDNPADAQRRTFLFELLCFAGNFDRAGKQLDILNTDPKSGLGVLMYQSAIHAERERQAMFAENKLPPGGDLATVGGTFNGQPFESILDGDSRLGARLELFAAGQYMWLPFRQIASITMEAPKRLRDLLWIPAVVRPVETFQGAELGEVLLPVLTPLAGRDPDDRIRLGRLTEWRETGDAVTPAGQKLLLIDDEDVPLLDLRELVLNH